MKRLIASTLLIASATIHPALAAGDLFIYTWGEYTPPEMVTKFEKTYDVKVHIDTYDSMETMLAKLKAGAGGYDVIVPGHDTMTILVQEGLVEPINVSQMENFKNVDEKWRDVFWDKGRVYSAPWVWGSTGIMVDRAVVKGSDKSLKLLFEPDDAAKGKINMLRDVNDVINMALRYLGKPRCNDNPQDLKAVLDLLSNQKAFVKSYTSETKELLVSGEAVVSMSWNGYAMRARDERPTLEYIYPREGYTGWMDNVAVPKGAPNIENAKLWVNFVMAPENAAMITNYARYSNGIKGSEAFVDKALADAPELNPAADTPEPEFLRACSPEVIKLYDRVWTKLLR